MKHIIVAGMVGGVILFLWGAIAWMVLPLHDSALKTITNEEAVIAAMKSGMNAKAVYTFPAMPRPEGTPAEQDAAREAWMKKYEAGPTGMVIFDPDGTSPMMPTQMVVGLINSILAAMIAAWLLSRSTAAGSGYIARVSFCGALGIFASLVTHTVNWNWMGYPLDYTTGLIADSVVGWVLAGLGIGKVIPGTAT
ncbi:MAG: hypothetical protein AB1428_05065 [Bacteroidota bacterium]